MTQVMVKIDESPLNKLTQTKKRPQTYKGPLRMLRLCILGIAIPMALVSVPLYLRYHVYASQWYPFAVSDMRLLDKRISTVWCQSQVVRVNDNATFNAFLLPEQPSVAPTQKPVSMVREIFLEDDMKEYWGFYLLAGSTVTVSTCVRWPGASLIVIRGHKHLHDCAYIGDDSSEELEEMAKAIADGNYNTTNFSSESSADTNNPHIMKRHRPDVHFHHPFHVNNGTKNHSISKHHDVPDITDPKLLKTLLDALSKKTEKMNKQCEKLKEKIIEQKKVFNLTKSITKKPESHIEKIPPRKTAVRTTEALHQQELSVSSTTQKISALNFSRAEHALSALSSKLANIVVNTTKGAGPYKNITVNHAYHNLTVSEKDIAVLQSSFSHDKDVLSKSVSEDMDNFTASEELFMELSKKLDSLGDKQHRLLQRLNSRTFPNPIDSKQKNNKINQDQSRKRRKRDIILSSAIMDHLNEDDEEGNAGIEEEFKADGIADHHGSINETTLNDRSSSEFWSSFSSSEEALLNCEGLILNLPLTPHTKCDPHKNDAEFEEASLANKITYKIPSNGYYFFVFNSENEVQVNYIRLRFQLNKTVYDVSNHVSACANSTDSCALDLKFFSSEKIVMEVPITTNQSRWNEEFVVVSECQPRTIIYVCCILSVPIFIMLFAFQ